MESSRYCSRARLFQALVSAISVSRNALRADVYTLDYEAQDFPPDNVEPPSPRSLELRDFETYNRTALPLLVEANLRSLMEFQLAPIEERVRAMVIDIVRESQSTVARDFHLTRSAALLANDQTQSPTQPTSLVQASVQLAAQHAQVSRENTIEDPLDFFHEPPHVASEDSTSFLVPANTVMGLQNPTTDSGYASFQNSCSCSCHEYFSSWNMLNGERSSNSVFDVQLI